MNINEAAAKITEWSGQPMAPSTLHNYLKRRRPHLKHCFIVVNGRRSVDFSEADLTQWWENMQNRPPKTTRVHSLRGGERLPSADSFYTATGRKKFLPKQKPSEFERRMLLIFSTVTRDAPSWKVGNKRYLDFHPETALVTAEERAALRRLADKGYLDRLAPNLCVYKINDNGWWIINGSVETEGESSDVRA